MPWCPVCKNEYKEGYTVCAECNVELVDSLDTTENIEEDIHNHDNIMDLGHFAETEALSGMDDKNAFADIVEGKSDFFPEDGPSDTAESDGRKAKTFKPYIKASDKANEYRSSAYSLLLVGIVGLVLLILCVTGVINIKVAQNIKDVGAIAMFIMFIAFIIIGIKSLIDAKKIAAFSNQEESLADNIKEYFTHYQSAKSIDEMALASEDESLTEELKYFKRAAAIKSLILHNYGEVDEAFLDDQIELMYNMIYGE